VKSHHDVIAFEERWIAYFMNQIARKHGDAIKKTYEVEVRVPKIPFPKVTMAEAERIVSSSGYHLPVKGDLDPKGERLLSEHIERTKGCQFVFVTDYPAGTRPFYHMRYADAPTVTKSYDLLFRGLEVTTGAQREHRYDVLVKQAKEKGLNLEPLQFYLDFFKYGCPPHGGFGFGLTRLLMQLLGIANVREVTYVYRGRDRLTP
jgi:aspartyl-tRNA synthetase